MAGCHQSTVRVCAGVIPESDDVPAPIDIHGEWAGDVCHAEVHGIVTGDVGRSTVSSRIDCFGFCALDAKERITTELEIREVLAEESSHNRLRRMAEASMPLI
jgi:hypothetical protein